MGVLANECISIAMYVTAYIKVHSSSLIIEILSFSADESHGVLLTRITLVNTRLLPLHIFMVLTMHFEEVQVAHPSIFAFLFLLSFMQHGSFYSRSEFFAYTCMLL